MSQLLAKLATLSLMLLCSACTNEYGDRGNAIQLPMFIVLLISPIIVIVMRRRQTHLKWVLFSMWALYLIYETGFSAMTNIRVDLVLLIPAMLLSTVLGVYWAQRD